MYVLSLIIFAVVGIMPNALAGYSYLNWEWWAACAPLWAGIWLRDYAMSNIQSRRG
jgi:hypothetical protein